MLKNVFVLYINARSFSYHPKIDFEKIKFEILAKKNHFYPFHTLNNLLINQVMRDTGFNPLF